MDPQKGKLRRQMASWVAVLTVLPLRVRAG
jgi:hypothetical protein